MIQTKDSMVKLALSKMLAAVAIYVLKFGNHEPKDVLLDTV